MSISEKIKNEIVPQFLYNGTFIYEEPFGCGHINSTFAVYFSRETKPPVRSSFRLSILLFLKTLMDLMKILKALLLT